MGSSAKIVGRWLHQTVAMAYETWRVHAHGRARMRGIMQRVGERWLRRGVAAAFDSWRERADRQRRAEYVMKRVVTHWKYRTSALVFEGWCARAAEQVRHDDAARLAQLGAGGMQPRGICREMDEVRDDGSGRDRGSSSKLD